MPQLKTNTVTVTNGSNSVVGSGTAWLTGPNPVTVGAYLIISDENGGSPTVYEVQAIPSDTSITLTTNWAGVTGTYNAVIHIDFLPNGVPQLASGDLETVAVINRAHKILGDDIASGTAAATTTTRGTVEKATSTESIAGVADDKFPDVKGVKAFLYDRMVGTVSQSGGVPTGAIIERGSNANGEYTKFADGTLICSMAGLLDNASISVAFRQRYTIGWTFPHQFSSTPKVYFNGLSDQDASGAYEGGISNYRPTLTTTTGYLEVYNGVAAGAVLTRLVFTEGFAIGLWY